MLKLDNKLNVEVLTDIDDIDNNDELLEIPKDSIIIGTTFLKDQTGKDIPISKVIRKVDKEINMPIFYLQESGLGHDVLGVNVLIPEKQGVNIGNLALRIFRGEKPSEIGIIEGQNSEDMFDYNVMQRFDISEKLLPKNIKI